MSVFDVSICIVNWNTGNLLAGCVGSIVEMTTGLTYEIIVCDNDSTDTSILTLQQAYPDCRIIREKNNGFSHGNNVCAESSTGEYLLFLNPDTVILTNAVKGMLNFLRSNADYGAVGCMLLNADETIQYSCAGDFSSPFRQFNFLTGLSRLGRWLPFLASEDLEFWDHKNNANVNTLSGACILMPRRLFFAINGFDESFFMYSEDHDLCLRIHTAGKRIRYLADHKIVHFGGASSSNQQSVFASTMQSKACAQFYEKHWGRGRVFMYRAVVFIGSVIRALMLIILFPLGVFGVLGGYQRILALIRRFFVGSMWAIGLYKLDGNGETGS